MPAPDIYDVPDEEHRVTIRQGVRNHLMLYVDGRLICTYIPAGTKRRASLEMIKGFEDRAEYAAIVFTAHLQGQFSKRKGSPKGELR